MKLGGEVGVWVVALLTFVSSVVHLYKQVGPLIKQNLYLFQIGPLIEQNSYFCFMAALSTFIPTIICLYIFLINTHFDHNISLLFNASVLCNLACWYTRPQVLGLAASQVCSEYGLPYHRSEETYYNPLLCREARWYDSLPSRYDCTYILLVMQVWAHWCTISFYGHSILEGWRPDSWYSPIPYNLKIWSS